ncbi:MAG: cytochrome c oxidase subunit II [Myxococcaceae bacterium]
MISRFLETASSFAGDIDELVWLVTVLVGFWFIVAELVLFGLIFKFTAKEGSKGQFITGENVREKRWVNWPHYLILVCDVFIIVAALRVWNDVKQASPPADETVRIVAQQWAWTFTHPGPDGKLDSPDDIRILDELHVEVGKTYHFELASTDVLHSFSVPVFRLKQDAIPGRVVRGWFKPTMTGTFDIQCTEICGIGHALMPAQIFVETPAAHADWLRSRGALASTTAPAPSASQTQTGEQPR